MRNNAVFSEDGQYRYLLTRVLEGDGQGACGFGMLNGSTATAHDNDPTVTRCVGFATGWGFKYLLVVNLFAFAATDPKNLMKPWIEPIGPLNDRYFIGVARRVDKFVIAWGNHGSYGGRDKQVLRMLESEGVEAWHLGLTKQGCPKHPLYVAASQPLEPYARH